MMHIIIGVMETAEYQPWCGVSASAGPGPDQSVVPIQALMWRVPSGRYQDITGQRRSITRLDAGFGLQLSALCAATSENI